MANWDYESIAPVLTDTRVDNIKDQLDQIDDLASLDLDIEDNQIVRNLNLRINDSQSYWDNPEGFDLTNSRNENTRMHLGKQLDYKQLYRYQIPYVENQIFVVEESIVAYLTARQAQSEVAPAQDSIQSRVFASDLEKVHMAHSNNFSFNHAVLEPSIRNTLNKRIGIIYLEFDPNHGENGEIIPYCLDPDHVIIDKNAAMGKNPEFICRIIKMSVNKILERWPEKQKEVFAALGISRRGLKNMAQEIAVRQVWVTTYKDNKPEEACVTYFGTTVLAKYKNPNWNYSGSNFLDAPMKPFIPINVINDGQHWIDSTTPIEQAGKLQDILNKRGRQIMENGDKANGMLVISTDSGLTKDDAQNLTGDPNQKLIIKTNGQNVESLVYQVPPHDLPDFVMQDKLDLRATLHGVAGTPSEFTGNSSDQQNEETLGQSMMKKNQASFRQDMIARAVDAAMDTYFKLLTQMMCVWYTEKHFFVYNGGDGDFDYVTMSRDLMEDGIQVSVKSGSTLPFDKAREEAITLKLADMGLLSPLDVYKGLHMPNPQQLYDNLAKWKTSPEELARDANEIASESDAFVIYKEIMNGYKPKPKEDASKEFVLTLRKLMLRDDFMKADRKKQAAFIKYVTECLDSLEARTSLDEMSQQGVQNLDPSVPIAPLPPPMPPMGMPGMMPPGMPGAMPPQGGMMPPPPPVGGPMGGPPMSPAMMPNPQQGMTTGSVMGGTGLPNPANPVMPPAGSVTQPPPV